MILYLFAVYIIQILQTDIILYLFGAPKIVEQFINVFIKLEYDEMRWYSMRWIQMIIEFDAENVQLLWCRCDWC